MLWHIFNAACKSVLRQWKFDSCNRISVEKILRKWQSGRHRGRWKDNSQMEFKERMKVWGWQMNAIYYVSCSRWALLGMLMRLNHCVQVQRFSDCNKDFVICFIWLLYVLYGKQVNILMPEVETAKNNGVVIVTVF